MNTDPESIQWVIKDVLARSCRPGRFAPEGPTPENVSAWITKARSMRIRTILCLLEDSEIEEHYAFRGLDLIALYREAGFHVHRYPIRDHVRIQLQPLKRTLESCGKQYKPMLIHCSAGISRTGMFIPAILQELFNRQFDG